MAQLLINKNDFKQYKQISKGKDVEIIEQYIQEAQDLDLKNIICRGFFFDLLKNKNEQIYQTFIHGETYTDSEGSLIEFKGLAPVIVYFAYARYILRSHVVDTSFGMIQKTNDFSQPISSSEKRDIRDKCQTDAMSYWEDCKLYLNEKKETFPKWEKCGDCSGTNNNNNFKSSVI